MDKTTKKWTIAVVVLILVALGLLMVSDKAGVEQIRELDEVTEEDNTVNTPVATVQNKGSYSTYSADKLSRANTGDVILFFRASWCPTCVVLDTELRASKSIPANVTILDVNFDTATTLKQKYAVSTPQTFVQVNASGDAIFKWAGSNTLLQLLAAVK